MQTVLDPSSYPLYIADLDGISHTSLVIGCLRKLQGWHADAIVDEISRFEPEYEDLPLMSFINTYLASTSDTPFALPAPPYPSWLWPIPLGPASAPSSGAAANTGPGAQQQSASTTKRERERERERERTTSSSIVPSPQNSVLPFPHPLTARKHPTMKLTFPAAAAMPPPPPPTGQAIQSPQLAAQNPNVTLSRVNSIRGPAIKSPPPGPNANTNTGSEPEHPGLVGAAANLLSNGLSRVASAVGAEDKSKRLSRNVSFENDEAYLEWRGSIAGTMSPERLSRQPTNISSEETSEQDVEMASETRVGNEEEQLEDEDEEEDEYDEDEDEDEEDDEDLQPPSQYISALDLAGF